MKIQAPPGMRDFYPEDMRLQNWLFDHWRSISRNFGFQEFEGPIFEYLDLYRVKSGGALVGELFHFTDRGQREFAIRPEMTPTLARMVAARANALPRPIKWFSLPRMCRAETPQRGRLREFFQWNVDILGVDDSLADAEVIAVAVEFFRAVGLGDEIVIRLNHRGLAAAALRSLGLPGESTAEAFSLIDRIERLPPAEFDAQWTAGFGAVVEVGKLREFLSQATLESCVQAATSADEQGAACAENFASLWRQLAALGVAQACQFDLRIVRGLAYYTGSVFEAHARKGGLRALLGGGRYDDLTGLLDGPRVPGIGFGMGDAPVLECLREHGKLPELADQLDAFLIDAEEPLFGDLLRLAGQLRAAGLRVDFSYKRQNLGKQLKQASGRGARFAVIVGREWLERGVVIVKNLGKGTQAECPAAGVAELLVGSGGGG